MSDLRPPRFETRRRKDLRDELMARARTWLPEWRPRDAKADFATALFEIAARLSAEVTERLDQMPEKNFRGFLDWLGVRGQAGRAARLPFVFGMAPGSEPVLAEAPVQAQALDVDPPVIFETQQDLMIVPGALGAIIGVDPSSDAYYETPPAYSRLEPPRPVPNEWVLKAPASPGATQLQLEPEQGLDELPTLRHAASGQHYRVTKVQGGIVTIDPPLGTIEPKPGVETAPAATLAAGERLTRVTTFAAFGTSERNRQEHAVYLGSESLLDLKTAARIEIVGGDAMPDEVAWSYWGKVEGSDTVDWQRLTPLAEDGGGLILTKPAGDVEVRNIAPSFKSRWLRGLMPSGAAVSARTFSQLRLAINCPGKDDQPSCPLDPDDPRSTVEIEAIANTAPVVLDTTFYPLGREPRLFDAFYLASAEALSKKNAFVEICFQLPEGTTESLSAARVGTSDSDPVMMFGIGKDSLLHRLRLDPDPARPVVRLAPVRPPFSENGKAEVPAPATTLNAVEGRLTTISRTGPDADATDVIVAATAGRAVWLWRQSPDAVKSRWFNGGTMPAPTDATPAPRVDPQAHTSVLLMRGLENRLQMIGLADGVLYHAELLANWEATTEPPAWARVLPPGETPEAWRAIAPVFPLNPLTRMQGANAPDGWLAIDDEGVAIFKDDALHRLDGIEEVDPAISPLALAFSDRTMIVVQQHAEEAGGGGGGGAGAAVDPAAGKRRVAAWDLTWDTDDEAPPEPVLALAAVTPSGVVVVDSFDWHGETPEDVAIVFTVKPAPDDDGDTAQEARALATWFPRRRTNLVEGGGHNGEELGEEAAHEHVVRPLLSPPIGALHGAPAAITDTLVASGSHAEIVVVPFNPEGEQVIDHASLALDEAWRIEDSVRPFTLDDFVVLKAGEQQFVHKADHRPVKSGEAHLYQPAPFIDADVEPKARIFAPIANGTFTGTLTQTKKTTTLKLHEDDKLTDKDSLLVIVKDDRPVSQHAITSIDPPAAKPRFAILDTMSTATGDVTYVLVTHLRTRPLRQMPALTVSGLSSDQIAQMHGVDVRFLNASPLQQVAFFHPPQGRPTTALLARRWTSAPVGPIAFRIREIYGAAQTLAQPVSVNPELKWEYFDGAGWWTLKDLDDGTAGFTVTGMVSFCVPEKLQPTEVVGRRNHWIRARLVAGDYGRENVTIESVTDNTKTPPVTTQTVKRSLDGIAAPQIASIDLRYSVCCPGDPDVLLTRDGGGLRDQSEANRRQNALVELFVPLATTIARASRATGAADDPFLGTRSLYFGFDTPLKGGPISLLFLVDEGAHDDAYPLQLDVLRETGFEPVPAMQDETRGLNETGVITFHLAAPPLQVSLFGRLQHWLRLRPNPRADSTKWKPAIRAAYLNATWARAADTQVEETLGSSDGSPHQRVFVARPPVLAKSLKLRVREPLGDEELEALQRQGLDVVLDTLKQRPGPWVLWDEVVDPADAAENARVYALDDETGEIRFGNGEHGRIPPAGQDAIIAESYMRGGGDEANAVRAWSQITLITPTQGIDRVVVPEGAAGGSDPQDAEAVIRFAPADLLMRDRALTLRDLEKLAERFSTDVAQARAFARAGVVELVVVMRGRDPQPSGAVRRELLRYIGERVPPMLQERGAVTIAGPDIVWTRVHVRLAIADIDHSGAVGQEAVTRIARLFDPVDGGVDGTGWRLGDTPTDMDLAAILDGVPDLEGIVSATLSVVPAETPAAAPPLSTTAPGAPPAASASLAPMPPALRSTQLARLVDEGISIEFDVPAGEAVA